MLRGSEYAWKRPVSEWTAEEGLARSDVTFLPAEGPEGPAAMGDDYVPKAMQLRIRGRRTDVFRHGGEVVFHATLGPLCVVTAVYATFLDGGPIGTRPGGPLFTGASGYSPLLFQAVTAATRQRSPSSAPPLHLPHLSWRPHLYRWAPRFWRVIGFS